MRRSAAIADKRHRWASRLRKPYTREQLANVLEAALNSRVPQRWRRAAKRVHATADDVTFCSVPDESSAGAFAQGTSTSERC
jgi:hypothetical protein